MGKSSLKQVRAPRCQHGVDYPMTRCDACIDIADEERWIAYEKRQVEATRFALDSRERELARRVRALARKLRAAINARRGGGGK